MYDKMSSKRGVTRSASAPHPARPAIDHPACCQRNERRQGSRLRHTTNDFIRSADLARTQFNCFVTYDLTCSRCIITVCEIRLDYATIYMVAQKSTPLLNYHCYYHHSSVLSGHLWSLQYLTLFRPR